MFLGEENKLYVMHIESDLYCHNLHVKDYQLASSNHDCDAKPTIWFVQCKTIRDLFFVGLVVGL